MHESFRLLPAVLIALLAGCKSYQADPLIPEEILREIERARDLPEESVPPGETGPDLEQLATWMLENSPTLAMARVEAVAAGALAEVDTPLPNPTLSAGPIAGFDLPADASGSVVPFVEFGFTIPLTGRLGYQDEVNELLAEQARTKLVVVHRRALLELRKLYAVRVLTHRRLLAQAEILESLRRSAGVTRQLVDAGTASALDVGLMKLEVTEAEVVELDFREREVQVDAALSSLIGVDARHLGVRVAGRELSLVTEPPSPDIAKGILLANNPDLAMLRARYAVAEKQLRLEIAKQYPDLQIGATFAGDPGTDVSFLGLPLGISLPIFDRNQQPIVVAEQARELIRTEYEATLSRALASLDELLDRHEILAERWRLMEEVALPRSEANVEAARQSILAGEVDVLRVLEVARRSRTLRIEILAAEEALRLLTVELEQLLGWPLTQFPAGAFPNYPGTPATTESTDPSSTDAPESPHEDE